MAERRPWAHRGEEARRDGQERRAAAEEPAARSPWASMTLLTEVMERPLDPSYAQAAQHRGRHYRQTGRERALLLVLAVVVGLVVTAAVLWLRAPQPASAQARTLLEKEIASARADVGSLTAQNDALHREAERLQSSLLSTADPQLLRTRGRDALLAAEVAVEGPGIVVTLRDGAQASTDEDSRVQDSDLQLVVNDLWAAGAEAVAVNGHRLGPTTAIRSAGAAILVDLVGVASPYEIDAIGSTADLQRGFASSPAADQLEVLDASYGIRSSVTGSRSLSLPAAASHTLLVARGENSVRSNPSSGSSPAGTAASPASSEGSP